MSDYLLDLLRNFLQSEFSVDMSHNSLAALDGANDDQLEFIKSEIYNWDRQRHIELARPLSLQDDEPEEARTKNRPFSAIFSHPYNGLKPFQVEDVKKQLLFYPRVAVVRPDFEYFTDLSEGRRRVKDFISSIIDLAPLIADGTVQLTPLSGFYSDEIEGGGGLIRRACIEVAELSAWIGSNGDLIAGFAKTARRNDPFFDAGVRIASALSYGHEFVATHPFIEQLYSKLMSEAPTGNRQDSAVGVNLERIKLPGLSGLTIDEIAAIRRDEPSFQRWRADIEDVMATIDPELPPEKFVQRFDEVSRARLKRAAMELDREVKESKALTRARKGAVTFGIGAIAAASTIATFPLAAGATVWGTVLKAVQIGGITAGLQFLAASKRTTGKKALRSHYSVFASDAKRSVT